MQYSGQPTDPGPANDERKHKSPQQSSVSDPSALETVAAVSAPAFTTTVNPIAFAVLQRRYDILAEAGRGAMGQVFKARDRETREIVALKILKPEIASDPAMVERFKSELLFARKITHKNVCRVYEFNRVDGIAFTSMEFVDGESLRSVLKRFGSVTQRKGTDIALQMCSGLREAHSQGIVHRDLKPENVMIDTHGNVKIMDFGIARSMETLTLTTGGLVGTPAYMAPEQAAGKPVDHRADIYAMGLMLYEMFTGTQVFRGDNAVAVALKHINETPRPPREVDSSISPALEGTILKCLEKDPDKRFQSIADLESDLRLNSQAAPAAKHAAGFATAAQVMPPIATSANTAASGSATNETAVAPSEKSKRAMAVGSVALIALIAVGARAFRHHTSDAPSISMNGSVNGENVDIHSAKGTVSITPDSLSINKVESGNKPDSSDAKSAASVVIHKEQPPTVTNHPKSQAEAIKKSAAQTSPGSASTAALANTQATAPSIPAAKSPAPAAPANESAAGTPETDAAENVPEPVSPAGKRGGYVWVGRFPRQAGAQNAANKIEGMGLPVSIIPRRHPNQTDFYVVLTGPYPAVKIDGIIEQLKSKGFAFARQNVPPGANRNAGTTQTPATH